MADTANKAAEAHTEALQLERYLSPRDTIRRNGDVVGSPRDKVDTAELMESQYLTQISPGIFELGYTADHASVVYNGATYPSGAHVPEAHWPQEAIRGDRTAPSDFQNPDALLNVPEYFARKFNGYL